LFGPTPSAQVLPVLANDLDNTYNWLDIAGQNTVIEAFLKTNYPHVVNVNPAPMIRFRPDCHKDPIHSCLPGFTDWIAVLQVHTILSIVSKYDQVIGE
jgi:hypothetical protein